MIVTYFILGALIAAATVLARGSARRLVVAGAIGLVITALTMPFGVVVASFTRNTVAPTAAGLAPIAPYLLLAPALAAVTLALAARAGTRVTAVMGAVTGVAAIGSLLAWRAAPAALVHLTPLPGILEVVVPAAILVATLALARGMNRRQATPVVLGGVVLTVLVAAFLVSPAGGTYFDALRGYYKVFTPATAADRELVVKDYNADLAAGVLDLPEGTPKTPISSADALPPGVEPGPSAGDAGVRRTQPGNTTYQLGSASVYNTYGFGAWLFFSVLLFGGGATLAARRDASEPGDYRTGFVLAAAVAVLAASFNGTSFDLGKLIANWSWIANFFARSVPPDFQGVLGETLKSMTVTLQTALVGTVLAATLALPTSLLAARNLTERSAVGRVLYGITRFFYNVDRGVDTLIVALIFVAAVGLGPFAGVLAMALHSMADLGKLYSEAIENADRGPLEALEAAGAPGTSVVRWALLPQVLPLFVSYTLYRFEINFRVSIVLGFVGAGGIGFIVNQTMRSGQYQQAVVAILVIVITVNLLDFISASVRRRLV